MSFNRKLWLDWEVRKPCPTCNVGTLIPPSKEKAHQSETVDSRENNYEYKSEYVFSVHLRCNNCEDVVVASGRKLEEYPYFKGGRVLKSIIPVSFYPAPKIITLPISCPASVGKVLNESFALYWLDLSSCANKIRIAIEILLNELNVISSTQTNKGKQILSLHKRIEEFGYSNAEVAKCLLAIKWIGNAGSHLSEVTKDDVLNAYELLEYSLDELYDDRKKKIRELSDKINSAKGPKQNL